MSNVALPNLRLPKHLIASISLLLFIMAAVTGIITGTAHEYAIGFVILMFIFVILRHLLLLVWAIRPRRPLPYNGRPPLVSIIMPAYNEEAVIEAALTSLTELDYSNLQIIVVDDGSTDNTMKRARRFVSSRKNVDFLLLTQSNSGKASALNTGIKHARGDFVLCVDSDSRLRPDAIRCALPHFNDPKVGAVGGAVEVANSGNLLAGFQELEYRVALNFTRRALSRFGAVTVIPGPVGMFRRSAILDADGYDEHPDVFAEDADLTVRLLSRGWKVAGETSMIAYTEAPQDVFALLRQRYRWKRGLFQAFDANAFSLVTTPGLRGIFIALFLALECFALDIINGTLMLFFLFYLLSHGSISPMLSAYLVIIALDFTVLVFVYRDLRTLPSLIYRLLIQRFSYALILQVWAILALFDEWHSTRMDWDKLERIGQQV